MGSAYLGHAQSSLVRVDIMRMGYACFSACLDEFFGAFAEVSVIPNWSYEAKRKGIDQDQTND